tara:strand:+ start:6647 stop:7417 length:771 start_codon:yes stop_codon:yes gene_type:complete
MLSKLIFITLATANAFFNVGNFIKPTIRLSSGKTLTIDGNGPPLLFSTGLYGTMPRHFYNELIDNLKKTMSVVTIDGLNPITPKDIADVVNTLKVDTIAYMSHSSFNPEVLETDKINSAVLVDPICIPSIDYNGVHKPAVDVDYPVLVLRAEKLYKTEVPLPEWQELEINGEDISDEMSEGVGHPDILDDLWGEVAIKLGLWGTAERESMNFKDWKFDTENSIPKLRKNYREKTSKRALEFINGELINGELINGES